MLHIVHFNAYICAVVSFFHTSNFKLSPSDHFLCQFSWEHSTVIVFNILYVSGDSESVFSEISEFYCATFVVFIQQKNKNMQLRTALLGISKNV